MAGDNLAAVVEVEGAARAQELFAQLALPPTFRPEVRGLGSSCSQLPWRCLMTNLCAWRPACPPAACLPACQPAAWPFSAVRQPQWAACVLCTPAQDASNKRPPFKAPFTRMVPLLVRTIRGQVVDTGVAWGTQIGNPLLAWLPAML